MDKYSYISNANGAYIDDVYQQYQQDPSAVDPQWAKFFEGYDFAVQNGDTSSDSEGPRLEVASNKDVAVSKLIVAYRTRGHLIAKTNPVRERRSHKADLSLEYFGLSDADLNTEFDAGHEIGIGRATLKQILDHLHLTYCSSIAAEFMYCRDEKLRQWLYKEMEPNANRPNYTKEKQLYILDKISYAVLFENFLQTKYVGKKRFSLEGVEALIPSLDAAINQGGKMGVKEVILGMAHRGRLNVLVNVFGKTYEQVFSEFEEVLPTKGMNKSGDVKYHLGQSADIVTREGHSMHLSLMPNPSHLEAVNPVVQGVSYAKGMEFYDGDMRQIMPILIHGDAAIAGQGVNYELVNMAGLDGYGVGGVVHIVLNNQVGFTANYREGRTSMYCTDIAKVTESPVFHVNADDPEAVVHAVELAIRVRQEFGIDVYVDILGYRRYGHNEGDEPRFTQPMLYRQISKHEDVYKVFLEKMEQSGSITRAEAQAKEKQFRSLLQQKLDAIKKDKIKPLVDRFERTWKGYRSPEDKDFEHSIDTSAKKSVLDKVAKALSTVPESVNVFSKMQKLLQGRHDLYFSNKKIDWAMGELLAYGSLLLDRHGVRISGQDCQRGTFSHRHAVIVDEQDESHYIPLNNIQDKQDTLQIYNSHLSEYCVMGFEYGYSLAAPQDLTIWEAQFGDFSNGAQIMIDQFISAAESKWSRSSGLTLLLPHGYEGQGPEHSSARPERYLQLCAQNNMYVLNPTTPANMFHALRRQVQNPFRIPCVIMTPKSLLRHPLVQSHVKELTHGRFEELIDSKLVPVKSAKRVIVCSGKIYYDLLAEHGESKNKDVAIVRLEQLYPLPKGQLAELRKTYKSAKEWVWAQEEPQNMGYWSHIITHLPEFAWQYVGRAFSASPAVGNSKVHAKEQAAIVEAAFKPLKKSS
ncbi:MAG: 2-oxoglutarate dehydrogenase E1 component [bacterium]|nr:2-oxoglutarate dehydrogenase E1 component [bacterium]